MIYTVTLNPSIDYIAGVENFIPGKVNRTSYEKILPGGKGINVSIVLKNLGFDSTVIGFTAGYTGEEIERLVDKAGIRTEFIRTCCGMSRINIKLKSSVESEINGRGPRIMEEDVAVLKQRLKKLDDGDILVMAGSIPDSLSDSVYMEIMESLSDKNVKIIVDATGKLLVNVLKYKPFLIKPNIYELSEIFGKEISENDEIIKYAKKLKDMGAENVLVSRAGNGAVLLDSTGKVHMCDAPKGNVINSVGAGDSMVAGFIAGYYENRDFDYALKMGIAAGSASAFSENLASKHEIDEIFNTFSK